LNKNDLIATVANDTGLGRREAAKAVDSVLAAIADALKGGDEVRLVGFGTFSVSERAASQGRNPRTGETIDISASRQPKFRAGKGLKDALN
jgi:DNA-binding protein HU-beta